MVITVRPLPSSSELYVSPRSESPRIPIYSPRDVFSLPLFNDIHKTNLVHIRCDPWTRVVVLLLLVFSGSSIPQMVHLLPSSTVNF